MKIEKVKLEKLIPYARNSRTHSDQQVAQVAASIREFGFTNPVLIDSEDGIIAGHGRIMAARKLEMTEVPCIRLGHLTETQKRAYIIADNKLALNSGWDDEMLGLELADLREADFDLDLIGFDAGEIEAALNPVEVTDGLTDPDEVPEPPVDPVTVLGDVWLLGNHRLMCGDSTSIDAVEKLMDGKKADFAIADPPYNVGYEYNSVEDNKSDKEYSDFCMSYTNNALIFSAVIAITPGKSNEKHYNRRQDYKEYLTWFKKFGLSRGSFYKAMVTEPILLIGDKPKNKFYPTDCLEYMTEREPGLRKLHTCPKPVSLWIAIIEPMTDIKSVVLEMFGGSGTTIIACEKTNRHARLMELDPKYCDVIVERWQDFTGKKAIHEASGKTFDEMKV
jgi:DNA modification methylase